MGNQPTHLNPARPRTVHAFRIVQAPRYPPFTIEVLWLGGTQRGAHSNQQPRHTHLVLGIPRGNLPGYRRPVAARSHLQTPVEPY